jgi:Asp/Glu/hydantoin racemase
MFLVILADGLLPTPVVGLCKSSKNVSMANRPSSLFGIYKSLVCYKDSIALLFQQMCLTEKVNIKRSAGCGDVGNTSIP